MRSLVIKISGAFEQGLAEIAVQLKLFRKKFPETKVVLVHGAGEQINEALRRKGIKPNFVSDRRYTDEKTIAVAERILKKVNSKFVKVLKDSGLPAESFSADEFGVMCRKFEAAGLVGIPYAAKTRFGTRLPVVYPVCLRGKEKLNINADDLATAIAAANKSTLVFLTKNLKSKGISLKFRKARQLKKLGVSKVFITNSLEKIL
jgi:acetylglutamate kinase